MPVKTVRGIQQINLYALFCCQKFKMMKQMPKH